jgi:hypothetical protein
MARFGPDSLGGYWLIRDGRGSSEDGMLDALRRHLDDVAEGWQELTIVYRSSGYGVDPVEARYSYDVESPDVAQQLVEAAGQRWPARSVRAITITSSGGYVETWPEQEWWCNRQKIR